MGVKEHEAQTFSYYELTKRSYIIVTDRFFAHCSENCSEKVASSRGLLPRFDQWSSWCRRLVRKRWEGVLAVKATRGWIDSHHLGDACVQSPGVFTQSVMSTVTIRSNLMGCQRTDHGCTKWCRRGDRKSAGRTQRPSTFECTWYSCTHMVLALSTRRALPFWIISVRPMTPTWFWGSQSGPTEITLADGREWKYIHISVQLLASLLHFIMTSVSALTVSAVQIQMMDRLNEGWSLHTMYICTFCAWLNPTKVCGSVLVWNTCTTCIFLCSK